MLGRVETKQHLASGTSTRSSVCGWGTAVGVAVMTTTEEQLRELQEKMVQLISSRSWRWRHLGGAQALCRP